MIKLWIDGDMIEVEPGATLLEAATILGKEIPTLCYLKEINEIGTCRLCLVEDERSGKLMASCITPAIDGMTIHTNTERVRKTRKLNLELLLSNHKVDCPTCIKSGDCELKELSEKMGIRDNRFAGLKSSLDRDDSTPSLFREPEKCILCRRCVSVCHQV